MAHVIERVAEHNGMSERIRVIRGDARDVEFDGPDADKPTLIVSEMIGSFGLDEDYLALLGSVRARCAPGCRVLPASVSIHLALASLPALTTEVDTIRTGFGMRLDVVADLLVSRPCMAWARAADLVSNATPQQRFSVGDPAPRTVGGPVAARCSGTANAIVGWFESELVTGLTLSSSPEGPATHWSQMVFPLDPPLTVVAGEAVDLEVRPRIITDRATWSWGARSQREARVGDAMKSLVGGKDDVLRRLGARTDAPDPRASAQLQRWAAALAGGVESLPVMAQRLRATFPRRYVDDEDAAREVERLVRVADR